MDATNVLAVSLESPAGPAEEERALVLAARKDANAADQLFDKYYPEIFRYLLSEPRAGARCVRGRMALRMRRMNLCCAGGTKDRMNIANESPGANVGGRRRQGPKR